MACYPIFLHFKYTCKLAFHKSCSPQKKNIKLKLSTQNPNLTHHHCRGHSCNCRVYTDGQCSKST